MTYIPCDHYTPDHFIHIDPKPGGHLAEVKIVTSRDASLWLRLRYALRFVLGRDDLVYGNVIASRLEIVLATEYGGRVDLSDADKSAALFAFMKARGLKAGPLAEKAGVSPSTLYNLKQGKIKAPPADVLRKIAAAEGVTVDVILAHASTASVISSPTAN
ncbi:hypothetical protein KL86PLE_100266 [uncultured Pleomorphomonas sp.]|uniref:HTH cro/C1-type domain-containing protein n=1 Tax=uncultured Pleomorphomonas sp. TaxID=442121 RepID=A0A212L1Y6_9HYPH|nr:helix-turn-helix transcriptional regulator [uncultured Pleomorphomonas sp.]SCM71565.1 hypothetical protein KL86PLE_100266 [uncultured Pleomorphomonas sp.]